MISFKEVFCSELPSPSNIFHSCSKETVSRVSASSSSSITSVGSNNANTNNNTHYHQFASEKHSLTLKTTTRSKSSVRELLIERLSTSDTKDAAAVTTSTATTCLAHSVLNMLDYLQDKRMSIQVFALMNENHDNGNNNNNGISSHDESSLETQNNLGGGNSEKEKLQQQSTNSALEHEKKGSTQDNNGTTTATTTVASTTTSSSPASSTYSLMVKIQDNNEKTLSNNRDNSTTKTKITERIYINFRPISVHLTQLYCTSSNRDADDHDDDNEMSSSLIVGIFVAGDDNKLHFYMTTLQVLRERLQEGEGGGTESTATAPTCFRPSLIFDKIDPATIISSSGMSSSSEDDYFSKDDPLTFTTPIMAIESCISSEPPSHATSKDVQNRLAVSCYNGMVRIVTYTITFDETSGSFRIAKMKCSSFIVDGPVASLHFGKIGDSRRSNDDECKLESEGKLLQQESYQENLFLLAGSLCGLAFLFYEAPPSTEEASFDGPIIVVDGLYDADIEGGSEDCVTSVHTVRYHGETMLFVGTQGSRLLMFQQVLQNDSASDIRDTLNDEIEKQKREISQLSSERDILRSKINDHCHMMVEIEKKDVEEVEVDGDNVEDDNNEDDGNNEEGQTETESTSDTSKKERLIVMKAEMDELEQACLDCTDKMSQLETSIDRLTAKLNDTPSPAQSVRKMHRYEFLWEHKLPYPIQSIGSSVCERSDNLECYITTQHTVHVFRVLSMRMVDAAAALLERKLIMVPSPMS